MTELAGDPKNKNETANRDEPVKTTKPPLDTRIGRDPPFKFGQRYLTADKDVYAHNAW